MKSREEFDRAKRRAASLRTTTPIATAAHYDRRLGVS